MATRKYTLLVGAAVVAGMAMTVACGGGGTGSEATDTAAAPVEPVRPVDQSPEGDFARNIEQIAAGVSDAKANFADDLMGLSDGTLSRPAVDGLAEQLGVAISGKELTPEQAGAIARAVLAAAATGADGATATADVEAALTAAGAAADKAAAAGVAAGGLRESK